MNNSMLLPVAVMALAIAGCTGTVEVQQTEPLRIQLDERPEQVSVRSADVEPQKVVIETCREDTACDVEEVALEVSVTQVSTQTTIVRVIVQDEDGVELAQQDIPVANANETGSSSSTSLDPTSTNSTSSTSPDPASSSTTSSGNTSSQAPATVVQEIVINVKGKGNLVVLTQALQGDANVLVAAREARISPPQPTNEPYPGP